MVSFSLVPAKFLSFLWIAVRRNGHRLICQFARHITILFPGERLYSANSSFQVPFSVFMQIIKSKTWRFTQINDAENLIWNDSRAN